MFFCDLQVLHVYFEIDTYYHNTVYVTYILFGMAQKRLYRIIPLD